MVVKKNEIQTVILTKDREFKHRTVNFLNTIAFNAEKTTVTTIEEAEQCLLNVPKVLNVIIDGTLFGQQVDAAFDKIKDMTEKPDARVLVYLDDAGMATFTKANHGIANLFFEKLPFSKKVFNDVFHKRSGGFDMGGDPASPFGKATGSEGQVPSAAAPSAAATEAAKKSVNVTAFEASNHVRDTIAMINIVGKNREALDQLRFIGQKFNGIVGAFAFFPKMDGYKELRRLSGIIDMISRHYDKHRELGKIADNHYNMLLRSAKTSFLLLQALRDSSPIPPEFKTECEAVDKEFSAQKEIDDSHSIKQDDIDNLINDLKKSS